MTHHDPAVDRYADHIRALAPSCGPTRLVGVDGHAGSGKSTFAARLAAALGGAPVLHLDDLASHDALFGWTGRLREQVLEPLARGETARYATYDWHARRFAGARELPPADVALVEGVGAGRREVRPWLASLAWMDLACEAAWARGRARDGAAQREFWDGWIPAERAHFAADPSRPFARVWVRERTAGYEVREPPAGTTGTHPDITHGEGPRAVR